MSPATLRRTRPRRSAGAARAKADLDRVSFSQQYIATIRGCLDALDLEAVAHVLEALERAWTADARIFLVGNGGSAATASHMANDLSKTVRQGNPGRRRGFRAIALTDNVPLLTAWANDDSYAEVFAGQLQSLAQPGDVLIVVSGSGNSPNVLRAVEDARDASMLVIGFLGRGGGRLKALVDISVIVPHDAYGPIEDIHLVLNHLITSYFCQWLGRHHRLACAGKKGTVGGRPEEP